LLIAIEGIDGAGKTTQAKRLVRWLKSEGVNACYTSEPTNSALGRLIKKRLRSKDSDHRLDALLFAADRLEHYYGFIEPRIRKGQVVVSDRYVYSSIAYQGALTGDVDWVWAINKWAPAPDVAIYIDISPEVGLARLSSRKISEKTKYERMETLPRVRELYLKMCNEGLLIIIDGERSIEEVQGDIKRITMDALVRAGLLEADTAGRR